MNGRTKRRPMNAKNARDEIRALIDSPVAANYHALSSGERAVVDIAQYVGEIQGLLPRLDLRLRCQVREILHGGLCDV